jgi:hypothetical protein
MRGAFETTPPEKSSGKAIGSPQFGRKQKPAHPGEKGRDMVFFHQEISQVATE